MFRLRFADGEYLALRRFLLAAAPREQAAFAYFRLPAADGGGDLEVDRIELLDDRDFVSRRNDYLELTDAARQRMIRTAHEHGLGVVELHSHPFNLPAEFSYADYCGLSDTVPHMLWRLKRRPYVAIVVGPNDFDGIVWMPDRSTRGVLSIVEGNVEFVATGRSLRRWQFKA